MIPSLDRIASDEHTITAIKRMLQCKKCESISEYNYFYHSPCHSGTFCLACIGSCKYCYMASTEHDPQLMPLLSCLDIRCVNYQFGCNQVQKYGMIARHEATCQFNPMNGLKYNAFQDLKDAPMFFPKASNHPQKPVFPPPIHKDQELSLTRRLELIENLVFQHTNECNVNKKEFMCSLDKLQSNFNDTFKEFITSKPFIRIY